MTPERVAADKKAAADKAAEDMIIYAPRRVPLAPHEPQSIRIAAQLAGDDEG